MKFERRFLAFDKTPIFYRIFEPNGKSLAVLIVTHGLGEHSGRYEDFASYLAEQGFTVLLYDLRGFGQSGGVRASIRFFSDYLKDLDALHRLSLRNYPNAPVFFLGHSLGGLITASYMLTAAEKRIAGVLLSSPLIEIRLKISNLEHTAAMLLSHFFPDWTRPSKLNPKYLTHNHEILRRDTTDPHISYRTSLRLYCEMIKEMKLIIGLTKKPSTAPPLFTVQAGEDFIVSKKAAIDFFNQLHNKDKKILVLDNQYHEVLNEINAKNTWKILADWLKIHLNYN